MRRAVLFLTLLSLIVTGCASSTETATPPAISSPPALQATNTSIPAPQEATDQTAPETLIPTPTDSSATSAPEQPEPLTGLPSVSGVGWQTVLEDLNAPIGLANAADGSGRLFILEQKGRIRILYPDGQLLAEPFLDISDKVDCCGERGLLGLVFHPNYRENGYFYINYTTMDGDQLTTIIARFQVSSDPDRADPGSEKELLRQAQPYPNHNGGGLVFGPDGYLYIGLGDGGSGGDPHGNGQSLDTWLGKLLRVDVDNGDPYAIPADNPFAGGGGAPEIWAYGLRNPWRFSFDRLTGDLYIGDVGQGDWEEIDYLPAGSPGAANFGWNYFEGAHEFEGTPPSGVEMIPPVAEYPHGPDISVTGGYVYRGSALPAWNGVYLYGDYGSGRVRGLVHLADGSWTDKVLFEIDALITSFGEDESGELYLTDHNGRLLRLQAMDNSLLPVLAEKVRSLSLIPAQHIKAAFSAAPAGETQAVDVLPDGHEAGWVPIVRGLEFPVGLANAADGSNRLFILEQQGRIRILNPEGSLLPTPFLDITNKVDCCDERGLLGLAFHPQYSSNGYFYINYTTLIDAQLTTIIARYQVSANPDIANPDSELVLISLAQPYQNHNGGGLAFGPDGYLYIALGDGGSAGDPQDNAQNLNSLLGKLLRIDVDGGSPYAIPPDNPFAGGGGLPEIWASGLRNPWRFSFDRLTGELFIGDVGQGSWEEIDHLPAGSPGGANFGWDYYEGNHPFEGTPPGGVDFVFPVTEYPHNPDISVTGGYVYRGSALPDWYGVYLYGDYGSGRIRGLLPGAGGSWESGILFQLDALITSFGEDEAGELYLTDHNGSVLRLEASMETYLPLVVSNSSTFAVVGDFGVIGDEASAIGDLIQSWKPDIILTTGDNNYPDGDAGTMDVNVGQRYHNYIYPYLGDFGQGAQSNLFFPALGNHDWMTDNAQPYFDYFTLPGNERYYDFTWGAVHFFALSNDPNEPDGVSVGSVQAHWLQAGLEASTSPWQVVYMHFPPYSSGEFGSTDWAQWPYAEWGADLVMAGHDHVYERLIVDGIPFLTIGIGGASLYEFVNILPESLVRFNETFGALLVEASADKLSFRFVSMDGILVDSFELTR